MLHGAAGRFWKWPENNENKLQHVQHEDGEPRKPSHWVICVLLENKPK